MHFNPKTPMEATTLKMLFLFLFLSTSAAQSEFGILPDDEVNILRDIANEVGKKDWKFEINPCSYENTSWRTQQSPDWLPYYQNQVDCGQCSGGICHVNLAGVLPKSLAKLPYLKSVNLQFNYISGTIPIEWASMSTLEILVLSVNRLSGVIPKQFGNITSLIHLGFENNFLHGEVPAELGKLVKLETLIISANYFTGQLPKELMNLSNLTKLWISSSNFSGPIPDYFGSWRKLTQLEMQSSGFMGPIPNSISNLTSLTSLKISDLKGHAFGFPPLSSMPNLEHLMLRNCNITGSIPNYLGTKLLQLNSLDLSFNKLEGHIPDELQGLQLFYMYLTSNFLSGSIPPWIMNKGGNTAIDLSYNNFKDSSIPSSCQMNNLNFFRSSSRELNSKLAVCLKNFPCSHVRYSLHINCGGNVTSIGKTTYDADIIGGGPAKFFVDKPEWGFSSTGHFWTQKVGNYIATNDSTLPFIDSNLYSTSRTSALSLTYYGRCLAKGKYTVTLHFAEIIFRDNNSFYSLGRRIFDVYIQERLVLKDFDIAEVTSGTDKIAKKFRHISVTDTTTIEIRFYYAGKGTTATPIRGTYGPLISAISVESEFHPLDWSKIIKIVIISLASMISIILLLCFILWRHQIKSKRSREILRELEMKTRIFTLAQIKVATDDFDATNIIGRGGFGKIYKGTLFADALIAVKRLHSISPQVNRHFVTEIGIMSSLCHPNLLNLYGCCVEGSEILLVYEYMVNNNLAHALFEDDTLRLDWPTRMRICLGIARGLAYLHEESILKIIHTDIKPTNILLDEEYNAKICDFGFARLLDKDNTHISTKFVGTAFFLQQKGNLMDIIDLKLESEYNKVEALRIISVALLCTNASPSLRPTMSQVVSMLEGDSMLDETIIDPNSYLWMLQPRWAQRNSKKYHESMDETKCEILSSDAS
ncbi:hypothetical protein V2J09_006544 [Rumex salicifolius]